MAVAKEGTEPLLEISDVTASYTGEVDVLRGITLWVHEGEIVSVVGPNGAWEVDGS